MIKLQENPPVRSPWFDSLQDFTGTWWVAQTLSRFEKSLAWELLHRDIGYFLPMTERWTASGGCRLANVVPLFPSYLFFCGTDEDRAAITRIHRVARTIEVADQRELVREMCSIDRALALAPLEIFPGLPVGTRCRVRSGAFAGLEGVVNTGLGADRIVLQLSIIGQGAVMHVDADLLEPLAR